MKGITREKVKVDRVACPWLIKKFVPHDTDWSGINQPVEILGGLRLTGRIGGTSVALLDRTSAGPGGQATISSSCSITAGRTRTGSARNRALKLRSKLPRPFVSDANKRRPYRRVLPATLHPPAPVLTIFLTFAYAERPRISEDRDLSEVDLTGWDCLNRLEGTAKTPDGVARNRMKNRPAIDLSAVRLETRDTATFLKHVADFDAQTKGRHRTELNPAQKQQLDALEKQIVSLTGYLMLAYVGPPESTNCGSADFHDWHLEVCENPADHAPRVGDPTPIICEITPRTQRAIYRDNIRIQALTGFFRRPDVTDESTGHAARKIRLTGYLMWDDEHNGPADVGTKIQTIGANKYHRPWRSTAWEIHPVLKIEPLEDLLPPSPATEPSLPAPAAQATPTLAPGSPAPERFVTLTQPVKIKIRYGETILPRGIRLPIVSREAQTVIVK